MLEQTHILRSIHDKSLTKENYIRILEKFYGFFHPMENRNNTYIAIKKFLSDLPDRIKADLIKQDMAAINGKRNNS